MRICCCAHVFPGLSFSSLVPQIKVAPAKIFVATFEFSLSAISSSSIFYKWERGAWFRIGWVTSPDWLPSHRWHFLSNPRRPDSMCNLQTPLCPFPETFPPFPLPSMWLSAHGCHRNFPTVTKLTARPFVSSRWQVSTTHLTVDFLLASPLAIVTACAFGKNNFSSLFVFPLVIVHLVVCS